MGQLSGGSFAKILTATTWKTVMMSTSALMPTLVMRMLAMRIMECDDCITIVSRTTTAILDSDDEVDGDDVGEYDGDASDGV